MGHRFDAVGESAQSDRWSLLLCLLETGKLSNVSVLSFSNHAFQVRDPTPVLHEDGVVVLVWSNCGLG